MNIEDKKFLAEWMGPDWVYKYIESKNAEYCRKQWNPDTNHDQFKEVWNKFTDEQRKKLFSDIDPTSFCIGEVLNNLPKVMDAVLEVIKEVEK